MSSSSSSSSSEDENMDSAKEAKILSKIEKLSVYADVEHDDPIEKVLIRGVTT